MANPILAAMNRQNVQSNPTNPTEANSNPITSQAQNEAIAKIKQYGGDGQKAFFAECQRMGIDPNYALQQIKVMFNQMYGGNSK